jgi:AcrR family transcriptional regulator
MQSSSLTARQERAHAIKDLKRSLILDAARKIFERDGLEGASLRAIAAEAGYTPAALYFHFESKEAIYAEILQASIGRLFEAMSEAAAGAKGPAERLRAATFAFFTFYTRNPGDLDLGFYLFRGGMKPKGLGRERNEALNHALSAALLPIGEGAEAMGASPAEAQLHTVEILAHATGILLLAHTGRLKMFGASPWALMSRYVDERVEYLKRKGRA